MADKYTIWSYLDLDDLLCQLAEEAAELAQAALKCRRAYGLTKNATPVTGEEAHKKLLEEVADVRLCMHILGHDVGEASEEVEAVMKSKLERWAGRLAESSKEG